MLRKLRRNSKDAVEALTRTRQDSGTTISTAEPMTEEEIMGVTRTGFFDLPAELRNHIYEFVISDATLSLPGNLFGVTTRRPKLPLKKKKNSSTPPINGLLLASKQCRREYLSVLLSTISVVVEIKDFDFENLIRVSSSLTPRELESLHTNKNLILHLHTRNCTQKSLSQLRSWLDFRHIQRNSSAPPSSNPSTLLPWNYTFPLHLVLPPTTMGKVRLLRELEYYADTIAMLEPDFKETDARRAELKAVVLAFECKAQELEDELGWLGERSKSRSQHVRGLAGGGLM